MPTIVKICGITNRADAVAASEAGADALGFVFFRGSPRFIDPAAASDIIAAVPPTVVKVGVFVNPQPDEVMEAASLCGLNLLQFHGGETPEFCLQFGLMTMKAFRMRGPETLEQLPRFSTDAWLLDAYTPGSLGGTGERFDWDLAVQARRHGRPVFLAGGLTPENVAEAIRAVEPYGVDVSSGVESTPGRKDHEKVRRFIANAKSARS